MLCEGLKISSVPTLGRIRARITNHVCRTGALSLSALEHPSVSPNHQLSKLPRVCESKRKNGTTSLHTLLPKLSPDTQKLSESVGRTNAQWPSDELSSAHYVRRAVGFTLDQTVPGRLLWLCRTTSMLMFSLTCFFFTVHSLSACLLLFPQPDLARRSLVIRQQE